MVGLLEVDQGDDIRVFEFFKQLGLFEGNGSMSFHDFNGTGLLGGDLPGIVDGAEVAVAYRILNLIFLHSMHSLYNIRILTLIHAYFILFHPTLLTTCVLV